ncbi:MAG: peptide ABC transporter substrate-binding protein [Clostridia bacterium]
MTLKKLLALALSATMLVASFTACSSSTEDTSSADDTTSSDTDVEEEEDDTDAFAFDSDDEKEENVSLGLYPGTSAEGSITANLGSEPTSLNTMLATYSHDFVVLNNLYTGLLELDENDNVIPGAAESWTVSDDGLTYTFTLREDIYWSNGTQLTANDFYFAWTTLLDPATAADYAYFGFIIENAEAYYNGEVGIEELGLEVTSDFELVVTLEDPTAYAEFTFTFGSFMPVNEEFYNEVGADNYAMEPEYTISCGAWIMESWTHDSNIVLTKNEDFYNADLVELDELIYVMITDTNTALNALSAGELDIMTITGDQLTLLESEGQQVYSYSSGATYYLLFNHEDEIMSNLNLRKALSLSYDRDAYIATVLQNSSIPANSFTNPGVSGSSGTSFAADVEAEYGILNYTDIEEAQAYLEVALEELDMTLEELNAVLTYNCGDSTTSINTAAFFQEQWRVNLGIEVTVQSMTTKEQSEARTAGNYMIDFTGWGPDYNDPMTFLDMWVSDSSGNSSNFASEEYDALVEIATTSTDLEERQAAFLEVEKIIADEVVVSNVYWSITNYTVSDKIADGFSRSTFQDMYYTYTTLN